MQRLSLPRWTLALALGVGLLSGPPAVAADYDAVNFDSPDGVKLQGYYFASKQNRKGPTVLMLHNFNNRKGGTALDDGWPDLAKALADKGCAVLMFDFRGHGRSTSVSKEFWTFPHNQRVKGFTPNPAKLPTTIAFTDFQPSYYNYFVNDIVAARAYLDGQNDSGDLNVSQLIVIGAGEGATVGALWMASEWHRHHATPPMGLAVKVLANYTLEKESEGMDQACGIWLSISPTLAGNQKPVLNWLRKVGGTEKVPMVFIYGDKDKASLEFARGALTAMVPGFKPGTPNANKDFQFTGEMAIKDSTLSGSKLLDPQLDTSRFIVESYIDPIVKKGQPQWRMRDYIKSAFIYHFTSSTTPYILGKLDNDKQPKAFPFQAMGLAVAN
jgi:hypothetical protein